MSCHFFLYFKYCRGQKITLFYLKYSLFGPLCCLLFPAGGGGEASFPPPSPTKHLTGTSYPQLPSLAEMARYKAMKIIYLPFFHFAQ